MCEIEKIEEFLQGRGVRGKIHTAAEKLAQLQSDNAHLELAIMCVGVRLSPLAPGLDIVVLVHSKELAALIKGD